MAAIAQRRQHHQSQNFEEKGYFQNGRHNGLTTGETYFDLNEPSSPPITSRTGSLIGNDGAVTMARGGWHDPRFTPHLSMEGSMMVDHSLQQQSVVEDNVVMNDAQFPSTTGWYGHGSQCSSTPAGDPDPVATNMGASAPSSATTAIFDNIPAGAFPTSAMDMHGYGHRPSFSLSPLTAHGWLAVHGPEAFEFSHPGSHAARQGSLFARSTNILRRDGIRKKNARFEIPTERNLRTIDQLISQTADESEIKELKQQKRLLRNRQAALDSRQRKKQHTERLEEEKKQYTTIIGELEDARADTRAREADAVRQCKEWAQASRRCQQFSDDMLAQKEEVIRSQTVEMGLLREKNTILLAQLQRLEIGSSIAAHGVADFPSDFADFDQLNIHGGSWDKFTLGHEYSVETEEEMGKAVVPTTRGPQTSRTEVKSPTSGLLLMLLLCGAWVVSRGSSESARLFPVLPDDLKTASADLVEDLYKDSGVQLHDPDKLHCPHGASSVSHDIHGQQQNEQSVFASSAVDCTRDQVTIGTQSLQSQDFANDASFHPMGDIMHWSQHDANAPLQQRAGDLMQIIKGPNVASGIESYTKSLLADKVPSAVLKDFAQMVAMTRANPTASRGS